MRILLVKTSSLGDVVHNLPVASDLRRVFGAVQLDWVVEQAFAPIVRMHGGVARAIPVATRRWRGNLLSSAVRNEIGEFCRGLRQTSYDAVIDTQGLFKSAWIARTARGVRHGLDWQSSREPLRLFYDCTYRVPWNSHAVERNRALAAQALKYSVDAPADYGISAPACNLDWLPAAKYVVLLHATSADRKRWPDDCWIDLAKRLRNIGLHVVLPWGSEAERSRSESLATAIGNAMVPMRLGLDDLAALLGNATAVIGVDTGLTHLAAALNVPTIGIYGATDPAATGLYGCARAANLGGIGAFPDVDAVMRTLETLHV